MVSKFPYNKELSRDMIRCGCFRTAVPNLFGTRERFHGRQFFHGPGAGGGSGEGMAQAVMRAMGSGR